MGAEETKEAIEIAHKTFQTWSKTTAKERHDLLKKLFDLMQENSEDLARLIASPSSSLDVISQTSFIVDAGEWEDPLRSQGLSDFPNRLSLTRVSQGEVAYSASYIEVRYSIFSRDSESQASFVRSGSVRIPVSFHKNATLTDCIPLAEEAIRTYGGEKRRTIV